MILAFVLVAVVGPSRMLRRARAQSGKGAKGTKKAPVAAKAAATVKVPDSRYAARPKNLRVGGGVRVKQDVSRFVLWPRYVRIQRQRKVRAGERGRLVGPMWGGFLIVSVLKGPSGASPRTRARLLGRVLVALSARCARDFYVRAAGSLFVGHSSAPCPSRGLARHVCCVVLSRARGFFGLFAAVV